MNETTEEITTHKKMIEALAYTLFQRCSAADPAAPVVPAKSDLWQSNQELRTTWRTQALEMVGELNEIGLRIVVGSQRKIDAAVSGLAVVPARIAYDFNAE